MSLDHTSGKCSDEKTEYGRQNTEGRKIPLVPPFAKGESRKAGDLSLQWVRGDLIGLIIVALFITACGKGAGGESGGNNGDSITTPSTTIAFSADTTSPGSNSVYMAKNNITGDDLSIDIKVNNISSGIYGTAFNVDFDSSKISYESYPEGSFLEQGGNSASYQMALQSNNSGRLVIGIASQGDVSGVTGSVTLITLKFRIDGNSSISFSDNELRDSSNQAISGINWYGGNVTVQ